MFPLTDPGALGPSFAALDPSGRGQRQENRKLRITPERLDDRRGLLATIMHTWFDGGALRLDSSLPRELVRMADQASPIKGLL